MGKLNVKQYVNEEYDKLSKYVKDTGISRKFTVLQIGNDPASNTYINNKFKKCKMLGIEYEHIQYIKYKGDKYYNAKNILEIKHIDAIRFKFKNINNHKMIQYPAPGFEDVDLIDFDLDVDGLTSDSVARLHTNQCGYKSCTAKGVLDYMKHLDDNLAGKKALVISRSKLVGDPLSKLLLDEDMFVSIAHSKVAKEDIIEVMKSYDFIISGVGKAEFFDSKDIPAGSTFIDVGISFKDGKMYGDLKHPGSDVDFDYTPVPGGVGQLTVLSLMKNIVYGIDSKEIRENIKAVDEVFDNKTSKSIGDATCNIPVLDHFIHRYNSDGSRHALVVSDTATYNILTSRYKVDDIYLLRDLPNHTMAKSELNKDYDDIVFVIAYPNMIEHAENLISDKYPDANVYGLIIKL